jgi:5-methylcytosine-specific restriction protein A
MPIRPKSQCRHTGCNSLIDNPGYCDKHRAERYRQQKSIAGEDYKERNRFYMSSDWKKLREKQLLYYPACNVCNKRASIADHVMPISKGGERLSMDNLQSLCVRCHNAKTMREMKEKL